jgi:hypothetical protein
MDADGSLRSGGHPELPHSALPLHRQDMPRDGHALTSVQPIVKRIAKKIAWAATSTDV